MAYEWVVAVSAVSGASIGAVGIVFTWLTAKQGREAAERGAANAWTRQQKSEAYVRALEVGEQIGNWAQCVRPMVGSDPPAVLPPAPTLETQASTSAWLLAYGSASARNAWEAWFAKVDAIRQADRSIALHQDMVRTGVPSEPSQANVWLDLETVLRPAEIEARAGFAAVVRSEIAGTGHGGADLP